ncbi:hypothetical protein ABZY44_01120 [Streptomyces sp. NPDC006544]|uniref:hypothetical protein n=1 Tax=Streptomyces sp. NPDC006544 TaxID=3154583 RepID=UPI0033A650F6
MITRPSDASSGPDRSRGPGHDALAAQAAQTAQTADPTSLPAAAGLGLLSLGGWLLTTSRPWQKPGSPLTLTLDWTASATLLLCGLLLLARCVRTVHRPAAAPYAVPYADPCAIPRQPCDPGGGSPGSLDPSDQSDHSGPSAAPARPTDR